MKRSRRLGLLAFAVCSALGSAAAASAAYAPRLAVESTAAETTIRITLPATDDPTERITLYAPAGWNVNMAHAPRTQLGVIRGRVNARDLNPPAGVEAEFSGSIEAINPAEAPASAGLCAPGTHRAIWLVSPSAPTVPIEPLPIIVDPPTSAESVFSSAKLQFCLRPPDTPTGTPGRAQFGVRVLEASINVGGVFSAPAGQAGSRWTAVFTPYRPGLGVSNPGASVEAQAFSRAGGSITLQGKLVTRRRAGRVVGRSASLTGRIPGAANAQVNLFAGSRRVATVRANASGAFSKSVAISRTTSFQARATVPATQITPPQCTPLVPPAMTCSSVSAAGFSARSRTVTVRVPRR